MGIHGTGIWALELGFLRIDFGLGFENSSATFLKSVNSSIIAHCADDESAVLQLLDDDKNKYT